jgi:hypothetical protein
MHICMYACIYSRPDVTLLFPALAALSYIHVPTGWPARDGEILTAAGMHIVRDIFRLGEREFMQRCHPMFAVGGD